jgi:hypothetical protein
MNPAIKEFIQSKVKHWASKVDIVGRKNLQRSLTETGDPWATIAQIQDENGIAYSEAHPPITFLNMLGTPSLVAHNTVYENMEISLINEFKSFDQSRMLMMLQMTIHFLQIHGLKNIPLYLIKSLTQVPEKYIAHLAKNCDLNVRCVPCQFHLIQ